MDRAPLNITEAQKGRKLINITVATDSTGGLTLEHSHAANFTIKIRFIVWLAGRCPQHFSPAERCKCTRLVSVLISLKYHAAVCTVSVSEKKF